MATLSIMNLKTLFNRQGFTKIARFTVEESSLYQALSVGLFEILIRLKKAPNLLSRCLTSYQSLTPSDAEHISNQLARFYNLDNQFNCFKGIADALHNEQDMTQAFSLLQQCAERNEYSICLDYGMRVLLASILPENTSLHEKMMRREFVDEQVLLFNFAIKLNIQINVVTGTETIEYKNHLPGGYPLMTLWMKDRAYSLLYTRETCMIEEGSFNYQLLNLETYPFFIPENYRAIRASNIPQMEGNASSPVFKIGNKAIVQHVENSRDVKAFSQLKENNLTQSCNEIKQSKWIPPAPDPMKPINNKVEGIPLRNHVDTSGGNLPLSPRGNLPVPRGNLPVPGGNFPAPGGNLLLPPGGNFPVPGGNFPVPGGNFPVSGGNLPLSPRGNAGQFGVGFPVHGNNLLRPSVNLPGQNLPVPGRNNLAMSNRPAENRLSVPVFVPAPALNNNPPNNAPRPSSFYRN